MKGPRRLLLLSMLAASGCPSGDDGFEMVCDGEGDLDLVVSQRDAPEVIGDGSEIPVFPPPQDGVFTELDVSISGTTADGVITLRVDVFDTNDENLAAQFYLGAGLPLACQEDGTIRVDNLPVGFNAGTILQDLEGVAATMELNLETDAGTFEASYDVVLRVTSF